jgi:hypothetical protein
MPVKALLESKKSHVVDQVLALPPQKKAIAEGDKRDDCAAACYTAQRTAVPILARSTSLAS